MWGAPEEPPDGAEVPGPSESRPGPSSDVPEVCEDNKCQLESLTDIMLKNKNDLKKKEEELQGYASKLSEIKSRAKRSRRSKDGGSPSSAEMTPKSRADENLPQVEEESDVVDISQAKTPKAKSSLLQRKLAENRKIFEQRSKELTESNRAVEEKVEAIRQQMDQTDLSSIETQKDSLTITPVKPVIISPQIVSSDPQMGLFQDKDNKIAELSNRILELEAVVIDLQDSVREKDSVIDSKMKAVTLLSADLSKKGKDTLDTLEDTKDEMRTMQENFVLIETSLKGKNENLLEQLQERNDRVADLEATVDRYEHEIEEKRLAETASANISRTTLDTLADTKDAMRSMQENFILIEMSLKEKNENLLQQLLTRETKLAEAEERIHKLETGAGIVSRPEVVDLEYIIEKLEKNNRVLQDEKYELQKSIAELQEKIIHHDIAIGKEDIMVEKDNKISELENVIVELKKSKDLSGNEEKYEEMQNQIHELGAQIHQLTIKNAELSAKNDEYTSANEKLEKLRDDLEVERNELREKLSSNNGDDATKTDARVEKLTKELDDLNKSMIKMKAQHKVKLRNLQKQLESFKTVSDANAELVKLGNQVALLEEEKGNLQLSLVDFDELKATSRDMEDRLAIEEGTISVQANEIQAHIEAIAILENQKLDLMQELHTMSQEVSALEAENAELENLRVTAEMKIVDLEEQIESLHKTKAENSEESTRENSSEELRNKIESLLQENNELVQKIGKLEEKPSSEAGSTESFETIHEDRNELMRKIEFLSTKNADLEEKLGKLEEATKSNIGSTESFETINDTDKNELMKKIDLLSRENSDLVTRLNKFEEKGSSDTGSTESFERIPEQIEVTSKIELLTRENNDLIIKVTKLEEKLENLNVQKAHDKVEDSSMDDEKLEIMRRENSDLMIELTELQEKLLIISEEKANLEEQEKNLRENSTSDELKSQVESLTLENQELVIKLVKIEERNEELREKLEKLVANSAVEQDVEDQGKSAELIASLEAEIAISRKFIADQKEIIEEIETKLINKEAELESKIREIEDHEARGISVENLQRELQESFGIIEEWKYKCETMERKMEVLEAGKVTIEDTLRILQEENRVLHDENDRKNSATNEELHNTIGNLTHQLNEEKLLIDAKESQIRELEELIRLKEVELHEKYSMLQNEMIKIDNLQDELMDRRQQMDKDRAFIERLQEEIQVLKADRIIGEEKLSEVNSEISTLREELVTKSEKELRNREILEEMKIVMNEQVQENSNLKNLLDNSMAENENLRSHLQAKENEIETFATGKVMLEDEISQLLNVKALLHNEIGSLQHNLDEGTKFAEDLKVELSESYRMLELLKGKHTEDIEMQNRRLEELIDELNAKNSESESLRNELAEKMQLIGELQRDLTQLDDKQKNMTESVKINLELKVKELEDKLAESEANTQAQLQKRKILAANLKKKSAHCEELENNVIELKSRLSELEPKAAELQSRVNELEPKAAEFETRAFALQAELAEMARRAIEFEEKALNLTAKLEELEPRATEFEVKILELTAMIDELAPKAAKFEQMSVELQSKVGEMETQISELESAASAFETRALSSEAEVDKLSHILEEKWETEKSEKEASDLRIQEYEKTIDERNTAIGDLEERLRIAQSDTSLVVEKAESLANELQNSNDRVDILTEETKRMLEEFEKLRGELELRTSELEAEKASKETLIQEFETQRSDSKIEDAQRQTALEEAVENARELGVRMEVIEAEYVDQLNTILTLRTENGMLVSKQAQINERLENAEQEASEHKVLLDQLQRENPTRGMEVQHDDVSDAGPTDLEEKPSCDQCDQCQTVVQALEAKLQEREAEIENLDNELANSIGNFVQMRESLRVSDLMNQPGSRSRNHDESRDELVAQYNALTSNNAELRDHLNSMIQENQELRERIASLEALNADLQSRMAAVGEQVVANVPETLNVDQGTQVDNREIRNDQHSDPELQSSTNENPDSDVSGVTAELQATRQQLDEWVNSATTQIQQLQAYNGQLSRECEDLTNSRAAADIEIIALREQVEMSQRRIHELQTEVQSLKDEKVGHDGVESKEHEPLAASGFFLEAKNDSPRLFDAAKLFGPPETSEIHEHKELLELRRDLANRDLENNRLVHESKILNEKIGSLESYLQGINADTNQELEAVRQNCERLENQLVELQNSVATKNRQIDSLNVQLNNVGAQLAEQFREQGNNDLLAERSKLEEAMEVLRVKDNLVQSLNAANEELRSDMEILQQQNYRWIEMVNIVVPILSDIRGVSVENEFQDFAALDPVAMTSRLREIQDYIETLRSEKVDLAILLDNCKRKISELEEEIRSADATTRIHEIEDRQPDVTQSQVDDLSRLMETMQEPSLRILQTLEETLDKLEQPQSPGPPLEVTKPAEQPFVRETGWDEEAAKLEDEEMWTWNPEDAQLAEGENLLAKDTLLPSLERRLDAKIAELGDTIKDLEIERDKLKEEIKTTQTRNGKLVKKLKEFKIQNESLQQQLSSTRATVAYCDLDSAIEEELRSQIKKLESTINEAKEEAKKSVLERENLTKRIDVLTTANERLVEMKERQDLEVEVLQMRSKELTRKLESIEWQFGEACSDTAEKAAPKSENVEPTEVNTEIVKLPIDCLCKKYKEELEELRDEMEALAAENELLQKVLEELKVAKTTSESRLAEQLDLMEKRTREINDLTARNMEIQTELRKSQDDYQSLTDQRQRDSESFEGHIGQMQQNEMTLRSEMAEKAASFEAEKGTLREEITAIREEIGTLKENLQTLTSERNELVEKIKSSEEMRANLDESMTQLSDLLNSRVQEVAELRREIQKLNTDKIEVLDTVEGLAQNHSRELTLKNEETQRYVLECESRLNDKAVEIQDLQGRLSEIDSERSTSLASLENMREEMDRLSRDLAESRSHRESLQSELANKEQELFRDEEEVRKCSLEIGRLNELVGHLQKSSNDTIDEANRRIREIEDREMSLKRTIEDLTIRESESVAQLYREISEKDYQVSNLQRTVENLEEKIHEIGSSPAKSESNDKIELEKTVAELRSELSKKNEEIENYKYQLSESTYPSIIQALQDQINTMYAERLNIERSLETALEDLTREREANEEFARESRFSSRTLKSLSHEVGDSKPTSKGQQTDLGKVHNRDEGFEAESTDLRLRLAEKDNEILNLRRKLESMRKGSEQFGDKSPEGEFSGKEVVDSQSDKASSIDEGAKDQFSSELDVVHYMLHQRDVRIEELTHELMQLLEERDTLQLKLSNAIRVNEELRRALPAEAQSSEPRLGDAEPIVEQPSPSRSVGPVEIAKEAIDSPSGEKVALAEKLTQLHNTGHRRDVRFMNDRDMRHNQQMSLLAHRDVLNTLPPEAAARLVNYTLSRDVQSQSSVIMNWLWGKSTPKVVHM